MEQLLAISDPAEIEALFCAGPDGSGPADPTSPSDTSGPDTSDVTADIDYYDNGSGITISRYEGDGGSVVIPSRIDGKDVTEIAYEAFNEKAMDRPPVTSVVIPDTVKRIEENAFAMCGSLTSVNLPDGIEEIGDDAFIGCSALTDVQMGSGVKSIGRTAFGSCTALEQITLPDSVTQINEYAFVDRENIVVTYRGNTYDYPHIQELYAAINS